MTETPGKPEGTPSPDKLRRAYKAFNKRLKLARLDEESKVTCRPVTSGKDCGIVAITPPDQFPPPAVWEELVRQRKLKNARRGMYELAEE
jgi:hypothetical protein